MATLLAEVLRRFGPELQRRLHAQGARLRPEHTKVYNAIVNCRTAALGGQLMQCGSCGTQAWRWHSCRNRHCPQCQNRQREQWRQARSAELLHVPYCHLVFTLPHELGALATAQPRWVYATLMQCVAATLNQFAADPQWLGGTGAFSLVLHTWTQDLRLHPHVHALMACGALGHEGKDGKDNPEGKAQAVWKQPTRSPTFLFPVKALSKVFKGKFMAALARAQTQGQLQRDPQAQPLQRAKRTQALQSKHWVVYAKTPLAGPAAVLDYLSRYTHRNAIGNERLLGIEGDTVRFRTRVNAKAGKAQHSADQPSCTRRVTTLDGVEFVQRLLQHVVPNGFKRIRHYGLLAPAAKVERMASARALLGMPRIDPAAQEVLREVTLSLARVEQQRCPHCKDGRWRVIGCQSPAQPLRQAQPAHTPACRGPP